MPHRANPFSTRFVRPGAISFLFEEGASADGLVEKLKANRWLGEITGPHGTGKSTLLESLKPLIEQAGRPIVHLKLTAENPSLKSSDLFGGAWNSQTLVIIDGYEQLSVFATCVLRTRRRLCSGGMLVTTHQSMGFPALYHTHGSEQIFERLVEELQQGGETLVARDDAAQALQASAGNVRDALFRLYDLHESRKRRQW